jgi:hypothetical protein
MIVIFILVFIDYGFELATYVIGHCVLVGFGTQKYLPALNLIRSAKLQACNSVRLMQNPC